MFKQLVSSIHVPKSVKKIYNTSQNKQGRLVGVDKFGNQYFETEGEILGRDRWVDYPGSYSDYDGSKIPPEWHSWLHHFTDLTGNELKEKFAPTYQKEHHPNLTATSAAYSPVNFLLNDNDKKRKLENNIVETREVLEQIKMQLKDD